MLVILETGLDLQLTDSGGFQKWSKAADINGDGLGFDELLVMLPPAYDAHIKKVSDNHEAINSGLSPEMMPCNKYTAGTGCDWSQDLSCASIIDSYKTPQEYKAIMVTINEAGG